MTEKASEIKAGMSNPAKILLAYMRSTNRWDSRELAAEFGIPLRTIQRWKMECAASATDATRAISGVSSENGHNATRATGATDGAPLTPDMALAQDVHSCAGANLESPTEINISEEDSVDAPQTETRSRGSRLPDDWFLPKTWGEWAEINTNLSREDIRLEAQKFKNHWIAKTGKDATKRNWMATWRNWCLNAKQHRPYNPQRMAHDERKARLAAEGKPTTLREALAQRYAGAVQ